MELYALSGSGNGIDIPDGLSYIPSARKGDPVQINRIQREVLFMLSKEAAKLKEMIDKAIEDHELTTTEYEKILALANADMKIDPQERQLLAQLHELVNSGAVKRVPG
jgi:hypothetical protein